MKQTLLHRLRFKKKINKVAAPIAMTFVEAKAVVEQNFDLDPLSTSFQHEKVYQAFKMYPQHIDDEEIFFNGGALGESLFFRPSLDLVKLLSNEQSLETTAHEFGLTALQLACKCGASHEVIKYLVQESPEAVSSSGCFGTSLHIACQKTSNTDVRTMQMLIEMYPEALFIEGPDECTPLHTAIANHLSAEYIETLLNYHGPQDVVVDPHMYDYDSTESDDETLSIDQDVIVILASHPNVRSLDCSHCSFTNSHLKCLFEAIPEDSRLRELHISIDANEVNELEDTTKAMQEMLTKNQSIRDLHLRLTQRNDGVKTTTNRHTLHRQAFEEALASGLARNTGLEELDIDMLYEDAMDETQLCKILECNSSIKRFSFRNIQRCGTALLHGLSRRTTSVESFSASGCLLTSFEIEGIVMALARSSATSLTSLLLQEGIGGSLGETALAGLSQLQAIQSFHIRHENLTQNHLESIFALLEGDCLSALTVNRCGEWSRADVEVLAKSLESSTLQRLGLGYVGSDFPWAPLVVPLEKSNCSLEHVRSTSPESTTSRAQRQVDYLCDLNLAGRGSCRLNGKKELVNKLGDSNSSVAIAFGLLRDLPHLWTQ